MAVYDLFLSRNSVPTASNYVGHKGRMFYDADEKVLRISDGSTPGGFPITPTTLVATTEPTVAAEGQMWYNPNTLALWCYHNGEFVPTIDIATETKIGGIKLGPGVTTNGQGQLIIDTAGLDFAFGDFYSFTNTGTQDGACLSSINPNQDVNLVSNGTGSVNVIGEFHVHKTNANINDALTATPIFSISTSGNVQVLAPNAGGLAGAVQIVGNTTGAEVSPNQTGVVVHVTGNQDMVSRNYFDGVNNYALLVGRRYNGTAASPVNVKNGELFFRIAGQASTGTGFETFGPCQIDWVATENQGPNNQGGELRIRATPNGVNASTGIVQVAAFNATTGVTAIKFNGPLTGDVTGNADTATKLAATKTINGVAFDGSANINVANTQSLTISTGLTGSVGTYNGSSAVTVALNTATLMANAVSATTATNAGYAYSFNTSTLVTNAVTVTGSAQPNITSVGTLTNLSVAGTVSATTGTFTKFSGKWIRNTRNAGTIAANGTLTIDFSTDGLVYCVWGDNMTINYQNYTAGSVVKVLATKAKGTRVDTLSLDGITASQTSSGSTSVNANPDTTVFVEFTCVGTTIGSVYAKF